MVATVNYTGRLKSDNSVFDSTDKKGAPFQFVLDQAEVIECWDKGFAQVPVGTKAKLNCPAEMAYGDVMKPGIPAGSDLVFDVELLSCEKDELADLDVSDIQDLAASGRLKIEDANKAGAASAEDVTI